MESIVSVFNLKTIHIVKAQVAFEKYSLLTIIKPYE
jgi:hypothetical protein